MLIQNCALKPTLLYQVHHFFCNEMSSLYPQHFIAIVKVEIDLATGKMSQQQGNHLVRFPGFVHVGFEDFYHTG